MSVGGSGKTVSVLGWRVRDMVLVAVLTGLAVLVGAQVAAADDRPTVTNVSDSPDSFSPNGDGRYDTTTIRYTLSDAAQVTLELRGPDGTLVDAARSETWDGKDDAGPVVSDGPYAYTIDAVDTAGNQAVQQQGDILVDNRAPVSLTVSAASSPTIEGEAAAPEITESAQPDTKTRRIGGRW